MNMSVSSSGIHTIPHTHAASALRGTETGGFGSNENDQSGRVVVGEAGGGFAHDVLRTLNQIGISASGTTGDSDSDSTGNSDSAQTLSVFMHDLFQAIRSSGSNSADGSTRPSSDGSNPIGDLAQALESGDLEGARTAFTAMQQNAPGSQQGANSGTSSSDVSSSFRSSIDALGSALDSGNLSAAQDAFSTLQPDLPAQAFQGGPPPPPSAGGGAGQGYEKLSSGLESLIQSLASTSGSSSSDTLSTLQTDFQNLVQAYGGSSSSNDGSGVSLASFLQDLSQNLQDSFGANQHQGLFQANA